METPTTNHHHHHSAFLSSYSLRPCFVSPFSSIPSLQISCGQKKPTKNNEMRSCWVAPFSPSLSSFISWYSLLGVVVDFFFSCMPLQDSLLIVNSFSFFVFSFNSSAASCTPRLLLLLAAIEYSAPHANWHCKTLKICEILLLFGLFSSLLLRLLLLPLMHSHCHPWHGSQSFVALILCLSVRLSARKSAVVLSDFQVQHPRKRDRFSSEEFICSSSSSFLLLRHSCGPCFGYAFIA